MPYPEYEAISCRNCGCELLIPPVALDEKYICPMCDQIVLVKIIVISEGFDDPDPRFLC